MDGIQNMKAFLMVSATRSFVEAARRLETSPSVVSKRINQLEWQLGAPLFQRTTRTVHLTDLGERHLPRIQRLVRDYDDLVKGALERPEIIEGSLRISSPGAMTTTVLAAPFARFRALHPSVSLEIVVVDRSINPNEEGFDITVAVLPASYEGVHEEMLCVYPRVICASPAYLAANGAPDHPLDLIQHQCVSFAPAGTTWEFQGKEGMTSVSIRPDVRSSDSRVVNELIRQGVGIGVASKAAVIDDLRSGALVEILPGYSLANFMVKALVPAKRVHLARVQACVRHLQSELHELDRRLASDAVRGPVVGRRRVSQNRGTR
jgi:DNA-binding transcriptional LysR family regulator